jgi:hypothetical protein
MGGVHRARLSDTQVIAEREIDGVDSLRTEKRPHGGAGGGVLIFSQGSWAYSVYSSFSVYSVFNRFAEPRKYTAKKRNTPTYHLVALFSKRL